jgi:anaerobic nitric oxide reductase flavorubredoxin
MWNGTRIMAGNIVSGIVEADPEVNIKIYNIARSDKNDVITDVFKSKAVIFGSPTINRGILTAMAGLLKEIKGLKLRIKRRMLLVAYGWSGENQ